MIAYNVKSMEGRITIFLFLMLIVYFVQAVPKTDSKIRKNYVNSNKLQIKGLKKTLRRQGLPESVEDEPPENFYEDVAEAVNDSDINDGGKTYDNENSADEDRNENNNAAVIKDANTENGEDVNQVSTEFSSSTNTRGIAVGDTFTPEELLNISRRLLPKVFSVMKGRGKGIVSSAQNIYELADRIYEAYFLTSKRIVKIQEADIDGLDALQALSLSGEAIAKLRPALVSYTESPVDFEGEYPSGLPQKCHYKVLTKPIGQNTKNGKTEEISRRKLGHQLLKKLGKNRKLVVNPNPKEHNQRKKNSQKKNTRKTKELEKMALKTKEAGPLCRWLYGCGDRANLKTCRLHPDCRNNGTGNKYTEDEQSENIRRFRKMVGMHLIDEEVERIVALHFQTMTPLALSSNRRIESLAEFFNSIIALDLAKSTTPWPPKAKPHDFLDSMVTDHSHKTQNGKQDVVKAEDEDDDVQARRILGVKPLLEAM